jgi:hypothetical protein
MAQASGQSSHDGDEVEYVEPMDVIGLRKKRAVFGGRRL